MTPEADTFLAIRIVVGACLLAGAFWLAWEAAHAPPMTEPDAARTIIVCDRNGTPTARIVCTPTHQTRAILWTLAREGEAIGHLEPFRARRKAS